MTGLTEPVELIANWTSVPFATGPTAVGQLEVDVQSSGLGRGRRLDVIVRNPTREAVALSHVAIRCDAWPASILEHGQQSWSVVRRCRPDDARPERAEVPDWVKGSYLSDPDAAGASVTGDQFLVSELGVAGFLGGARHLGTVTASPAGVTVTALLDGVGLAAGAERRLEPVWLADGAPGPLYSEFASLWGDEASARVHTAAPMGWCSWYQYFGDVTAGHIRANLALAADHGFDLVQIDDGYQAAIGDWLSTAPGWDDMAKLAAEIRAAGAQPGIWTAPFLAGDNSRIAADHPDWLAIHHTGHPLKAAHNDAWGGWTRALDTTNPAVLDHLRSTYASLTEQGFDYHKIDFCFAASLPGRRHDPDQTRAEALRAGLQAVRDGIGERAFLLGCGCPFGPAVGIVDAMRVSADVAPVWEADLSWPGFEEAAPAAINAVKASVLRAPLHRRVFINDPDCLLLRPTDTKLSPKQRSYLAAVIAGTGGFTIVSDDLGRYTDSEWGLLDAIRAVLGDVDTPLDIDDPFAEPIVVRSRAGTVLTVSWDPDGPAGLRADLGTP